MLLIFTLILGLCLCEKPSSECQKEVRKKFESVVDIFQGKTTNYTEMFLYSGLKLNNLGEYDRCNDLEFARYVLVPVTEGVGIGYAFCFPKICTKKDIALILSGDLEGNSMVGYSAEVPTSSIIFPKEVFDENCTELDAGAICMITFIVIISLTVIIASIMEIFSSNISKCVKSSDDTKEATFLDSQEVSEPPFAIRLLLCFSAISNFKKLFDLEGARKKDTLDVLNGVRVMSIGWVITGHVFLNYGTVLYLSNYYDFYEFADTFDKTIIYGAFFAVDTFFWLSGLLMAFLFLKELDKPIMMPLRRWVLVYLHRYLRITPLLLFVILFWMSMQPYLGNGPVWYRYDSANGVCNDNWWTNILYINNLYPDWKGNTCLGVSWYLANDMQFFVVSPLILLAYHKYKPAGWGLILALVILSMLSSGLIADHFDLNPSTLATQNGSNYYDYYYVKPYTRCGPYAMGLGVGMVLYTYKTYLSSARVYDNFSMSIANLFRNPIVRYCSAAFGVSLTAFFVFFQYDLYRDSGDGKYDAWGEDGNIAFITFWRVGFIMGLTMVLLPCLLGYFPQLTMVLGAPVWSPLAKLTFAVYLMHYYIVRNIYLNQYTQIYFDEFYLFRDVVFVTFFTYCIAVPIVLLIEMPCVNIERLLLRRNPMRQESSDKKVSSEGSINQPIVKEEVIKN